jgi:hypothetical protein
LPERLMDERLIMSNIESVAHAALLRAPRSRALAALFLFIALSSSMLLAGGCADLSEDPDDWTVDAGVPDAAFPDAAFPPDAAKPPEPVYFLVAELPGQEMHNDSYVVPLTRVDHIEHARDLVQRGPEAAGTHIVVANMLAGADGINRDLRDKDSPPWSWHVTGMIGFSDMTMEILDGWPGFVEQDVAGWIENTCFDETATEGTLGFWGYTVVEELEGYPESLP